jgi:hypothetical protein
VSIGLTFVRDEDGVTLDRVLLRRTDRESPTVEADAVQWRAFVPAALRWDCDETVWVAGLRLMNTRLIGTDEPGCISDMMLRHLHFGWDDWRAFVDEMRAEVVTGESLYPRDLIERLRGRLDEIERVAIAASSDRDGSTPGGEHWRWECTTCDQPIPITPVAVLDEHLQCPTCEYSPVALRSAEDYPTESVGPLSHFVVPGVDELRPVDGLHLQTHDPAHVLRTIQAHRKIIDRHKPCRCGEQDEGGACRTCGHCSKYVPCPDVRDLASIYFPESDA